MHVTRTTLAALTVIALTAAASAKPLTLPAETNLRAAPGTKSEVVTLIPKGSEVEIGECDAGWCKVKFGDKEGFAIGRNVGETSPETAAAPRARTQTNTQANSRTNSRADMQKLRQGYEQYFDGNKRNDVTGSIDDEQDAQQYPQNAQPQQRYAQPRQQQQYVPPRNARPQYNQPQYDDDDDEDDVAAYVPAQPPVYYSYGPYPRAYYAPRPYYYRRW
jgi:uncharacterized protein YraI